ncbi:hypothetical protein ACVI1J_006154 [Bradyrhizobium diazoefficiens]|uniref:Uncharacterized protein n=1 Tax=Bradyrhizobium diazoefficiens TaxID=1355477 RepID=A0A809YV00_9BRAD|nr:hypothetical protein F07S3_84040 [Bradyrhizobium diazoefficiens]BCA16259.1 hypothetical protein BDHF08_81060 [Bradyrhizobium diazoefficiens]BCA24945.1 hypothetical protein BDHH15_81600 [Bradyrhizobium diazoefficiens]BCE34432.1 hypothetical protein XF2B_82010 [Bradyrhizobium diazoefficiens]BCE43095.1 hypothetical protein XF3B_81260 [Bradyrhizobium diazoefficiens]
MPLSSLAIGDVVLNANRIKKAPVSIADARRRHLGPDMAAILAGNALFDAAALELARELALELTAILRHIFRMRLLENC